MWISKNYDFYNAKNKYKLKSVLIVEDSSFLIAYFFNLWLNSSPQLINQKLLACLNEARYWTSSLWIVVRFKQTVGLGLCFKPRHETLLPLRLNPRFSGKTC